MNDSSAWLLLVLVLAAGSVQAAVIDVSPVPAQAALARDNTPPVNPEVYAAPYYEACVIDESAGKHAVFGLRRDPSLHEGWAFSAAKLPSDNGSYTVARVEYGGYEDTRYDLGAAEHGKCVKSDKGRAPSHLLDWQVLQTMSGAQPQYIGQMQWANQTCDQYRIHFGDVSDARMAHVLLPMIPVHRRAHVLQELLHTHAGLSIELDLFYNAKTHLPAGQSLVPAGQTNLWLKLYDTRVASWDDLAVPTACLGKAPARDIIDQQYRVRYRVSNTMSDPYEQSLAVDHKWDGSTRIHTNATIFHWNTVVNPVTGHAWSIDDLGKERSLECKEFDPFIYNGDELVTLTMDTSYQYVGSKQVHGKPAQVWSKMVDYIPDGTGNHDVWKTSAYVQDRHIVLHVVEIGVPVQQVRRREAIQYQAAPIPDDEFANPDPSICSE